ncbi:MAG: hypothetical protein E4H44_01215 [Candidatus Aminicenantes bacterium]|nr:MAG: hypothetical protein E4H44_01215 [Candidatus Aminicenantes bacterium]
MSAAPHRHLRMVVCRTSFYPEYEGGLSGGNDHFPQADGVVDPRLRHHNIKDECPAPFLVSTAT